MEFFDIFCFAWAALCIFVGIYGYHIHHRFGVSAFGIGSGIFLFLATAFTLGN